jgi:uncharacterized protein
MKMKTEKYRVLAAVIAAHPDRKVVGRTRLQKTVRLLQRLGLPTDYGYTIHFYGPYSEDVQSDIGLLKHFDLVEETLQQGQGDPYYVIKASEDASLPDELNKFRKPIELMSKADGTVLELAATYDAFRETGDNHEQAIERVHRKKGSKCEGGKLEEALKLLSALRLPSA